jgi:hypothetical protein
LVKIWRRVSGHLRAEEKFMGLKVGLGKYSAAWHANNHFIVSITSNGLLRPSFMIEVLSQFRKIVDSPGLQKKTKFPGPNSNHLR